MEPLIIRDIVSATAVWISGAAFIGVLWIAARMNR